MDDDFLDGCDIDLTEGSHLSDEDLELYPLFAEALDPNNPKTVEEAKNEWEGLFNAPTS